MITYKDLIFDEEKIMKLYLNNEWYNYTNSKEKLFQGIKNSIDVIAAYDGEELVGLIRTIGDITTIIYVQDLLVLKDYHRKGIGSKLLNMITEKYDDTLHIILTTDTSEKTSSFYKSCGFRDYPTIEAVGFKYFKEDKGIK